MIFKQIRQKEVYIPDELLVCSLTHTDKYIKIIVITAAVSRIAMRLLIKIAEPTTFMIV